MTLSHGEMIVRMLVALLLGSLIGFERGRNDHPAGLRTHALVALASALFMVVSAQFMFFQRYVSGGLVVVDSSRIATGVVTGMGFIGGGAILRTGLNVHGITTAACLWLVSAIGLAAGGGMYAEAVTATLVSLLVLLGLNAFELRWKQEARRKVTVDLDETAVNRADVVAAVNTGGVVVTSLDYDRDLEAQTSCIDLEVRLANEGEVEPLLARLEALCGVRRVRIKAPDEAS